MRRYVVSFLIALLLFVGWTYRPVWRCLLIHYSSEFIQAPGHDRPGQRSVFVHRTATAEQRAWLGANLHQADERIRRFWGSQQGQATIIYCQNQEDYERYCAGAGPTFGEGAGCSVGLPTGTSFLVLGPEGNSADVIAHELCHDELLARLGWWTIKRQIPQWFNEGLALQVDYRFAQSPEDGWVGDQPAPDLNQLETTRDFFGGEYRAVMRHYVAAHAEVARWLKRAGQRGLLRLTQDVAAGQDFQERYGSVVSRQ